MSTFSNDMLPFTLSVQEFSMPDYNMHGPNVWHEQTVDCIFSSTVESSVPNAE
jgi:hypothetical protein